MKRAEAIKMLNRLLLYCGECPHGDCEKCVEAINMAEEALEQEQERREDIYECPNCIGEVHKNYIYCPFCGIKVDEGITMTTHGAIKILRNTAWLGTNEDREKTEQAIEVVAEALEQEQKRGKWLPENADVPSYCSVCGHSWDEYIHGSEVWYIGDLPHFCPNCGADMRGDTE